MHKHPLKDKIEYYFKFSTESNSKTKKRLAKKMNIHKIYGYRVRNHCTP